MIGLDPALVWMAAGLVLLVAEVLAPGMFLMWLGLAALGTGLVEQEWTLGLRMQVVTFAAFAAVSLAVGLRVRRVRPRPVLLNTPESGLVGRSARLLELHGRQARVRVGDSDWQARLASDVPAPALDARLSVVAVEGTVLVVRPTMDEVPSAAAPTAGGS